MSSQTSQPVSLRGARHPRIEHKPPHVDSFGEYAIELCAAAGLYLDPWQQDALTLMLATRDDGKWACFEYAEIVSRQNGKGSILEARALVGFLLLGEKLIMWSAHEYKTAMEGFRRFRTLLRGIGQPINDNLINIDGVLVKVVNTNGEESFERTDTGARVKFVARSKGSGRGFSGDVIILDEAYAYTPDQHAALLPTTSARPNPQIIYTSSPPLEPGTGEILFNLRKRALGGSDTSLAYRDWGVAGDLSNLDRVDTGNPELWAASNPSLGIRITEETIDKEYRSLPTLEFARERLGVWPLETDDGEGGPISPAAWAELSDDRSRMGDDIVFAVDVSPDRTWASIAAYGVRPDGHGHTEIIDRRQGTDWVVRRLVELCDRWKPLAVAMDVRGPVGSLLVDIQKHGIEAPTDPTQPERGQLAIPTSQDVAAACGQFADAVTQQTMRHLGQEPLSAAIAGLKTRPLGDAWAWGRKHSSTDISPLVAATMARWAYITRIDAVLGKPIAGYFSWDEL